ncbi:MAG: hypothetical protein S4CHLAM2_14310 [Chlamydiales bacterium]|nr:hypothetical protein [Chlamydiales bacterium]
MTTTITSQQAQARGYNLTEPVTIYFKAPSRNKPDPNSPYDMKFTSNLTS